MIQRIGAGAIRLSLVVSIVCIAMACADKTPVRITYDSLYVGATVYDGALQLAGEQYRAGNISEAEKDQIIAYAVRYKLAIKTATRALAALKKAELAGEATGGKANALDLAMEAITIAQGTLSEYIQLSSGGK